MSFILEIQEIVWGPIRDLYVEVTAGLPVFKVPPAPSVGDISVDLGSSGLGSTFGDANLGSSFGDANLGSTDFGSSFGSSNGDQNLGSSGLELPSLDGSSLPGLPGLPGLPLGG